MAKEAMHRIRAGVSERKTKRALTGARLRLPNEWQGFADIVGSYNRTRWRSRARPHPDQPKKTPRYRGVFQNLKKPLNAR